MTTLNRNSPPTIPLRDDSLDGVEWPANWVWDCKGLDLIAERMACRFLDRNQYWGRNRKMFAEVKSNIAIALAEAQQQYWWPVGQKYWWPVGQTWASPNGTAYRIIAIENGGLNLRMKCVADGTEGVVKWADTKDWTLVEDKEPR